MPEPMNDNARIVREALDSIRPTQHSEMCRSPYAPLGECGCQHFAMEALDRLESALAAARKALVEALPLETFWLDYTKAKAVADRKPISAALNGDSHEK